MHSMVVFVFCFWGEISWNRKPRRRYLFIILISLVKFQGERQGCIQKFCQGGANLGYGKKRGGGSFVRAKHAI